MSGKDTIYYAGIVYGAGGARRNIVSGVAKAREFSKIEGTAINQYVVSNGETPVMFICEASKAFDRPHASKRDDETCIFFLSQESEVDAFAGLEADCVRSVDEANAAYARRCSDLEAVKAAKTETAMESKKV